MHAFRTGCKQLIHRMAAYERVVKFFEWLARTSEWLTHPFKRLHRTTEQVIKFFKRLTRTGELTRSNGSSKFPNRFPQTTEQLMLKIISKRLHFTTGRPVSSGIKLLFGSYP